MKRIRGVPLERRGFVLVSALLITASAFAQTESSRVSGAQQSRPAVPQAPPPPRDGEGPDTVVVPILIYHSIRPYIASDTPAVRRYIATPETLDTEFAFLKDNGFTSIHFDQLVSHITEGIPLPLKPVIISFDDDWESQYTYALPVLKKYSFTATFFIWTVVVGMKHHMTWDEVKTLDAAGMEIGCHTVTHPYLTRVKSDDTLRKEIAGAKKIIENRIGKPVTSFAYPFGQYNERVVAAVREAGFTCARSTWPGVVHSREGLFSLTGLIRTDTRQNLVDSVKKYLGALPVSSMSPAGGVLTPLQRYSADSLLQRYSADSLAGRSP